MAVELETTFYKGNPPITTAATLATVPQGYDWIIDSVIVVNESSSTTDSLTLDVVSSGGTAGATTKLADAAVFGANAVTALASATQRLGIVMHEGDFVSGVQSNSANFNVFINGRARQH